MTSKEKTIILNEVHNGIIKSKSKVNRSEVFRKANTKDKHQ